VNRRTSHPFFALALPLALGLVLSVGLLASLALAQAPVEEPAEGYTTWLILDSARPVDEILPGLLEQLAAFQAAGRIVSFDPVPQASAPNAVSGVRVVARGETDWLDRLPGVLAAMPILPPAPPQEVGIQAITVITGRVTEAADPITPINGAYVDAYDGVTFMYLGSGADVTDADGYYTITVDSPYDQVKLYFDAAGYAPEWFDNKPSFGTADTIAASGPTVTGKNAQLERANAALVGTVVFTPGGQPVDGAWVDVYQATDGYWWATATTVGGAFTLTGLISDVYKVQVSGPPAAAEWYQDHPATYDFNADLAAATPVVLAAETTRTLAIQVERTAVITGRLTDAVTGQPISNTLDAVVLYTGSGDGPVAWADTDASGVYTLAGGIGAGSYKIWFGPGGYEPELYDNFPSDDNVPPVKNFGLATLVTLAAGQTLTNINAALNPSGSAAITGRVTSYNGTPLADVDVELWELDPATGDFANSFYVVETDASGVYTFTGLANGVYRVRVGAYEEITVWPIPPFELLTFTVNDPDIAPHAVEWFNDANVITTATNITITDGISQTGKDVQLALGGCLAGKILDSNGVAMSLEPFLVYQVENNNQAIPVWLSYLSGWTIADWFPPFTDDAGYGEFRACGLPTGSYVLSCDQVDAGFLFSGTGNRVGQRITATVTAGQVTDVGVCTVDLNRVYLPSIFRQMN
jgi:protocatechuate 3,4-dioxygenase beta subunit